MTKEEQALKDFMDSIEDPERKLKLEQLQWKIDGELRKYKDPVARMNRMVELFWEGFKEFQEVMNSVSGK